MVKSTRCWWRAAAVAAAVVPLFVTAAAAADGAPPRYDPLAHCKKIAEFGGTYSEAIYGSCLSGEQGAYNQLKERWPQLPQRIVAHCDKIARLGGSGTYTILQSCINSEIDDAKSNADTEFKF